LTKSPTGRDILILILPDIEKHLLEGDRTRRDGLITATTEIAPEDEAFINTLC
jgi:hypothetical protein